jgi:3-keto-5-aminohexanoate cleavage enzyme
MTTTTLITVAPTGAEVDKGDVPALPVTLDELVATAKECQSVGAGVIHVHIRDADAKPTLDLARLRATVEALRESTDLIVQLSSGGAVTDPESDRLAVLDAEPEMASCTMGTVNFGDDVFLNRWEFIVELHTRMRDRGIVPEYEIFDLGHLTSLRRLLDQHGLPFGGHVHVDLVMGVPGGMPGTAAALTACVAAMADLPEGTTFSATGIGRTTLPVLLASLASGGHLRVGMEDTITYAKGKPVESNAQLVARAAAFARLAQRPTLSPEEARQMLGIPARP